MDDEVLRLVPIGDVVIDLASPVAELARVSTDAGSSEVDGPNAAGTWGDDPHDAAFGANSFLAPTSLHLDVPFELVARGIASGVTFAGSLPRQPIVTSVMPVYHRLRLSVAIDG